MIELVRAAVGVPEQVLARASFESVAYSFPRDSSDPETTVLRNVLVGVRLTAANGEVAKGYGEAQLRDSVKPVRAGDAWREDAFHSLNAVLELLVGARFDVSSPRAAVVSIASSSAAAVLEHPKVLPACLYAVETALLDGVAKLLGLPLSSLLAASQVEPCGVVWTSEPSVVSTIADPEETEKNAKTIRLSRHSLLELAAARSSGITPRSPVLFVRPEIGLGVIGRATASHAAACLGASVAWPDLDGAVELVLPAGPGQGVAPDWAEILSGRRVTYFSTGPLQSRYEQPANHYDGEMIQVLGPNGGPAFALTRAALARGADIVRYAKGSFVVAGLDGRKTPFVMSRTNLTGITASAACNQKEVTRALLAAKGVPVARGRTFRNGDWDAGVAFAQEVGFPVVLKPAAGFRGIGVYAGLTDEARLREAMLLLKDTRLGHQDFIVEKHVSGEEYRILVVGDRAVAAIRRIPAGVTGDGVSSVAELILKKNELRRSNPSLRYRPIKYGDDARALLSDQGLSLASVPGAGEHVALSSTSNLSQGGDSVDAFESLHPSILEMSVKAARAIPDLGFAGVDFQLESPELPVSEQTCAVLEMNAHASISGAVFPMYGTPRDVPALMVEELSRRGEIAVQASPRPELALHVTVRGRLGRHYDRWIARLARQNELVGWVKATSDRSFEFLVQGDTDAATVLSIAAVLGPKGSKPTSAVARQIEPAELDGFEVLCETEPEPKPEQHLEESL